MPPFDAQRGASDAALGDDLEQVVELRVVMHEAGGGRKRRRLRNCAGSVCTIAGVGHCKEVDARTRTEALLPWLGLNERTESKLASPKVCQFLRRFLVRLSKEARLQ